jgi:hypothetical protein
MKAGEELFEDWADDPIPIRDPRSGPTQQAPLF